MRLNKKIYLLNASKSCEPSAYLINRVITFLKINGYKMSNITTDCDTIIINTCCVTQNRILNAKMIIEQTLKQYFGKKILVFGCLANMAHKIKSYNNIFYIGPNEIHKFNLHFSHKIPIEKVDACTLSPALYNAYQRKITPNDYFINICSGCVNNCSYCNIKRAKGLVKSINTYEIIKEIKKGLQNNFQEFVLLGDDCGSYGYDINVNIGNLLNEIFLVGKSFKIKVYSLYPGTLISLYPLIRRLLKSKRISYINIPMQSGSQKILKLMNRNYSASYLIKIIKDIKYISPETWLYTHIMFNFPTESYPDFLKSIRLSLLFDEILYISYSDNSGTKAYNLKPKVPNLEQKRRTSFVNKLIIRRHNGLLVET
jgi:threonylcarbamoyladenosine tRNA methylthiotransferase CDKAL1